MEQELTHEWTILQLSFNEPNWQPKNSCFPNAIQIEK